MEMEMIEGAVQAEAPVTVTAGTEALLERLTEVLGALERAVARLNVPAEVRASATSDVTRKTVPPAVTNLLAKQGVSMEALGSDGVQAGVLDAALGSLSLEQRIAVKAQLLRAGMVG